MPMRGELPLVPPGAHYEDIRVRCPVVWAWMAVLLQFWQDHMTRHLYGGRFHQASELANTLIRDINMWMPHSTWFGWNYVATHASLWLDIWDQFARGKLGRMGSPEVLGSSPSMTSSKTLKQCTGPTSSGSRMTRHAPIVRRQPHRSCHLNDEWLTHGKAGQCHAH